MKTKEVGPDPTCKECSGTGRNKGSKTLAGPNGDKLLSRWDFGCWKCNPKARGGLEDDDEIVQVGPVS